MNLDDLDRFKQLDTQNMLGEIDNLPDQLGYAYQLGLKHELPNWTGFKQVVIAGMGGSAIGADLSCCPCRSRQVCPLSGTHENGVQPRWRGGSVYCCGTLATLVSPPSSSALAREPGASWL